MINQNVYTFQTNSNLGLQLGNPFSFEETVKMASQDGDIYVTMFCGECND